MLLGQSIAVCASAFLAWLSLLRVPCVSASFLHVYHFYMSLCVCPIPAWIPLLHVSICLTSSCLCLCIMLCALSS